MRLHHTSTYLCLGGFTLLLGGCGASDQTSTSDPQESARNDVADDESVMTESGTDGDVQDPRDLETGTCALDTGWDGDDLCIEPPASPEEGFQLHVGPADHDDPDAVEPFLLAAGQETVECWHLTTTNETDIYNQQRQYRMRPGTHHLILRNGDAQEPEGWGACPGELDASWGGAQNSVTDVGYGELAPEDEGYASLIEARMPTAAELHYVNTGSEPLLREIWVNVYAFPEDEVEGTLQRLALIGGLDMDLPPGAEDIYNYSVANDVQDRRIHSLVGHAHAHTTRFSAWRVPAEEGERELLYESYNWAEPQTMYYNTVAENPEPDPDRATDGGRSGTVLLDAGDEIEWECEVFNDLDTVINFGNLAFTGEMCILFGSIPAEERWLDIDAERNP